MIRVKRVSQNYRIFSPPTECVLAAIWETNVTTLEYPSATTGLEVSLRVIGNDNLDQIISLGDNHTASGTQTLHTNISIDVPYAIEVWVSGGMDGWGFSSVSVTYKRGRTAKTGAGKRGWVRETRDGSWETGDGGDVRMGWKMGDSGVGDGREESERKISFW